MDNLDRSVRVEAPVPLMVGSTDGCIFTSNFNGMGSSSRDVLGYLLIISSTSFTLSALK